MANKYAVIGVGASVFKNMHRPAQIAEGINVVAVCDIDVQAGKQHAQEIGCAFYQDHHAMLKETKPDVVVIVTPHPSHPSLAIDCLCAGCHVLVEKPMAIDVASADQMAEEAEKTGRILAINFQHRFRPVIEKAHALIAEGAIGELVRTLSIEPWYRTEYYYSTAG
jgi:UDP-N-acetyl-2-amino-2-deoxyglucuronate dehydrogenase